MRRGSFRESANMNAQGPSPQMSEQLFTLGVRSHRNERNKLMDLGLWTLTCCHLCPFPTRLTSFASKWSADGPACLTGTGPVEMTFVEILQELKFEEEVLLTTVVSD